MKSHPYESKLYHIADSISNRYLMNPYCIAAESGVLSYLELLPYELKTYRIVADSSNYIVKYQVVGL